ncbi:phage DNA ejection protein [Vibrio fluvialis]|uniref:phage DNA ejection protein n=1 Tax=Vibrio fluvialis TaxID=676 RepID=UPI00192CD988|nr:phage DNA ejection protein [Vibrio fluvialis]MBL4288376.1 phage DNA ejection protein [Vibrio fluvialis]MBL4292747.1 phage DNA ejection protein [Vibrio fluvialis]
MQGYNPDWSGLLSANSQMSQALGQFGGLAGQAIDQRRAKSQAVTKQEQMQSEINSALQSGDPNQIAQVSIKYPKMSQAIRSGFEFKNDATEKNFVDTTSRILSDPENTEKYLNQRIDYLKSIGADPSDTVGRLQMYKDNPANFLKTTEGVFAASYPERYRSYMSTQIQQQAPQYSNVQFDQEGRPFGLNKKTGQFEPIQGGFVRGEQKPQTVVNVGGNQSKFDEEIGKLNAKAYTDIQQQQKQVRAEENKVDRLIKLNEKAFSGPGANAKLAVGALAKNLGIDISGMPESEAFRAVSNELVLDKSQQMSGALSEGDMAFLQNTVPNLSNTREGRKQVFDYNKALLNRQKDYAKQAQQFRKDKGYFDQGEFEAQFQQFADQNPLFGDAQAKPQDVVEWSDL